MQLQREILKNTKNHCMKMSNFLVYIEPMKLLQRDRLQKLMQESYTIAHNATMKWLKRESLNDTKSKYMKESSTFSDIAAMKQLWYEILKNTKYKCLKESKFLVDIALKQLQMDHLQNTRRKVMKV